MATTAPSLTWGDMAADTPLQWHGKLAHTTPVVGLGNQL
jgi:hypothetical protein